VSLSTSDVLAECWLQSNGGEAAWSGFSPPSEIRDPPWHAFISHDEPLA